MSTNDERETLHKIATNAIEVLTVYDKLAGAAFEAALASLPAPAPAAECQDPKCFHCGDSGEIFGHADDCDNDSCSLNGDIDSCLGKVEPCECAEPASDPCKLVVADRNAMIDAARRAITDRYYAGGKVRQMTAVKPRELAELVLDAALPLVFAQQAPATGGEEAEVTAWDIAQAERHYPPSSWRREAIMDLARFVASVRVAALSAKDGTA
ncbi:hypothetical protein [Novosphingobium resinovorum]|uniref:Uncharacterized protein n=1 Tax=Novosphingobium resinovorum TaxID=158500 RepID=A0A1D8A2N3_9SPHN|nr:hypothetical protein [Novosphingobium resinovorum]AOR76330.1 hypothetical protein BES08_05810 [Novosphingobium resinovorum]